MMQVARPRHADQCPRPRRVAQNWATLRRDGRASMPPPRPGRGRRASARTPRARHQNATPRRRCATNSHNAGSATCRLHAHAVTQHQTPQATGRFTPDSRPAGANLTETPPSRATPVPPRRPKPRTRLPPQRHQAKRQVCHQNATSDTRQPGAQTESRRCGRHERHSNHTSAAHRLATCRTPRCAIRPGDHRPRHRPSAGQVRMTRPGTRHHTTQAPARPRPRRTAPTSPATEPAAWLTPQQQGGLPGIPSTWRSPIAP
jgi:hypothetical protein